MPSSSSEGCKVETAMAREELVKREQKGGES